MRVSRRAWQAPAVLAALCCLAGAAYFAFDWADYGTDSTCGNFFRYKGHGGTCADIMRNRILGVIGLVALAIALGAAAVWPLRRRASR